MGPSAESITIISNSEHENNHLQVGEFGGSVFEYHNKGNGESGFFLAPKLGFFALFDGISTAKGRNAILQINQFLSQNIDRLLSEEDKTHAEIIEMIAVVIDSHLRHISNLTGQKTAATGVIVLLTETGAQILHRGDARLYLFRDNVLKCLTLDHIVGNIPSRTDQSAGGYPSYRTEKYITLLNIQNEGENHSPESLKVAHAFGHSSLKANESPTEQSFHIRLQEGDIILLADDGAYGALSKEEMEKIIKDNFDLGVQMVCNELLNTAKTRRDQDHKFDDIAVCGFQI